MARPTNRYARAQARARYRKPKRSGSSIWWNVAIGVIVILGIGGVVVSRTESAGGGRPQAGDHWHAQIAANVCGDFLNSPPEFTTRADDPSIMAGIHTHGDGFMHIEPLSSADTGGKATFGRFLELGGWDASEDSFELWDGGPQENGGACPDGQAGEVRWAVNGEERDGNPADYRPKDGDVVVLAFLPAGQEIPAAPPASPA